MNDEYLSEIAKKIASALLDQCCLEIIQGMLSIAWRFVKEEEFSQFLPSYPITTIQSSFEKLEKAGVVTICSYGYVLTDFGKNLLGLFAQQKNSPSKASNFFIPVISPLP